MKVIELVKKSEELIQWEDSRIHGLDIPSDERTRLAAACFDVAIEHQKSIVLLLANSLYGSAFSLVRLIFEAYIRGVWLYRCASKNEIEKYKKGKIEKTFGQLIADVENVAGYEIGTLSAAKEVSWKTMNSYTHSGFMQIVRRITESSIEPNYDVEEIRECWFFTSAMGLMSALEISLMAKNETLAKEMLEKIKELSNEISSN